MSEKKMLRKEYERGYADAMNWKTQNHLEHLPPKERAWVGLTDEEIKSIEETTTCLGNESWLRNLTRNLEARLKEKNT